MMGNFFNSMYNGKNRSDFTPDQLPDNRFKLFFEMLKTRLFKLVQLNLLFLLFMIPLLFFVFSFFMYTMMYPEETMPMLTQTLLLCIPSLAIAGIGLTGLTYVVRNWARDEHASVASDFFYSVKQNWKQGLLVGLLDGLLLFFIVWAGIFYSLNSGAQVYYYIFGWMMLVLLVVVAMANIYIWPMIISYDLKLRHQLRNALILTLGRLPFSLLFLIITLLPLALGVLVGQASLPVMLFYVLIGFSLAAFINVSYTNATFDKYINVKIEGAPVNMGLRVDEDDDYEDEDGETDV